MHRDEIDIDESLVRNLVASQFPELAQLPIKRIASAGTDNAIFRLGDEMAIRLPRISSASKQIDKECEWLPKLAPHLPLAVPVPIEKGTSDKTYPWHWSICKWIEGEDGNVMPNADLNHTAKELAGFINSLHAIAPADGPPPGEHNFWRGVPLKMRDSRVREAIDSLRHISGSLRNTTESEMYDSDLLGVTWEALLSAPELSYPPVWIHGDLQAGNLLFANVSDEFGKEPMKSARLSAIIDFGGLAIGDPACDLMPAWTLFDGESREIFRRELKIDDATWARGRGWVLSVALIALPYYLKTNPTIAQNSRQAIDAVIDCAETE